MQSQIHHQEEPDTQRLGSNLPSETEAETSEPTRQEEAEAQISALVHELRRRRFYERIHTFAMLCVFIPCIIYMVYEHITSHKHSHLAIFSLLINGLNLITWIVRSYGSKRSLAQTVARLDEAQCIGPLIDVCRNQGQFPYDQSTRDLARSALTRLLPRLKASDASLLSETHRAALRDLLVQRIGWGKGVHEDAEFLMAILKAFDQIGDKKCIPMVEQLAQSAHDWKVCEAAQACLPYLQDLAAREHNSQTLLRAAGAASPDTLLRPASAGIETEPQQLLRAGSIDERSNP